MRNFGLCVIFVTCFVTIFGNPIDDNDFKNLTVRDNVEMEDMDFNNVTFRDNVEGDSLNLNNLTFRDNVEVDDLDLSNATFQDNIDGEDLDLYNFTSTENVEEEDFDFNSLTFGDLQEDAVLSVPELIKKYGYPAEVHHVNTEDGYILEMHRIPYGAAENAGPKPDKPAVFVQHGLLSSSADWLVAGPNKGLGYLLADLGYDVWIGNARGNKYSRKHVSLSPESGQFWKFSWHEIGIYDLPAMIDYTLKTTNKTKIYYIGHSQGSTSFFVMCSLKPEYNSKIRAMFSLAPIAYMYHMTSPLLQIISKFDGGLEILSDLTGIHEFLPSNKLLAQAGETFCSKSSITQFVCTNSLFVLCGFSLKQMDRELLPIIMGHSPAGASTRQLHHYAQNINQKNKFRQYDYGFAKNVFKYKSIRPPSYNISKITAPVALFYSHNDWMAAEVDVLKLYEELANPIGSFLVTEETFNHLDYLWAKDVDTLVYNQVFSLMNDY